MLGRDEPYAELPWFWSDQYGTNMQYVGHASDWDEVVFRGDTDARNFTAFYLKDGVLKAALAFNRFRDIRRVRPLIEAKARPDPAKLRDDSVDLRELASEGG